MKIIAQNRSVKFNYFILETFECGISLQGTEVKSVRSSKVSLSDSYCSIKDGQMLIKGMYIAPYKFDSITNIDSRRDRVLLLHKHEILKIAQDIAVKGMTVVPVKVYIPDGSNKVKVEIALVKGKHTYDKRASIAERDAKRKIERSTTW